MMNLILDAYEIPLYRLSQTQGLSGQLVDIEAKMPVDTTRAQFDVMLQNLLADRLGLKVHWETQQIDMYVLEIAKGGSKLKLAAPDSPQTSDDASKNGNRVPDKIGSNGFPIPPPGNDSRADAGDWQANPGRTVDGCHRPLW
jgi:uncharacterized protein (TIGR03435 family)